MFNEEENEGDILEIIKRLMEELTEKMEYNTDDFEARLGRKKPDMEVSVIKSDMPIDEVDEIEEVPGMGDDEDDADSLKDRLMRLRKA